MIKRMVEATRKEYLATDEATIKELVETYIDLANKFYIPTKNEALEEYINQQSVGFGLMEQVQQSEIEEDNSTYYLFALMLLFFSCWCTLPTGAVTIQAVAKPKVMTAVQQAGLKKLDFLDEAVKQ